MSECIPQQGYFLLNSILHLQHNQPQRDVKRLLRNNLLHLEQTKRPLVQVLLQTKSLSVCVFEHYHKLLFLDNGYKYHSMTYSLWLCFRFVSVQYFHKMKNSTIIELSAFSFITMIKRDTFKVAIPVTMLYCLQF